MLTLLGAFQHAAYGYRLKNRQSSPPPRRGKRSGDGEAGTAGTAAIYARRRVPAAKDPTASESPPPAVGIPCAPGAAASPSGNTGAGESPAGGLEATTLPPTPGLAST